MIGGHEFRSARGQMLNTDVSAVLSGNGIGSFGE